MVEQRGPYVYRYVSPHLEQAGPLELHLKDIIYSFLIETVEV